MDIRSKKEKCFPIVHLKWIILFETRISCDKISSSILAAVSPFKRYRKWLEVHNIVNTMYTLLHCILSELWNCNKLSKQDWYYQFGYTCILVCICALNIYRDSWVMIVFAVTAAVAAAAAVEIVRFRDWDLNGRCRKKKHTPTKSDQCSLQTCGKCIGISCL